MIERNNSRRIVFFAANHPARTAQAWPNTYGILECYSHGTEAAEREQQVDANVTINTDL